MILSQEILKIKLKAVSQIFLKSSHSKVTPTCTSRSHNFGTNLTYPSFIPKLNKTSKFGGIISFVVAQYCSRKQSNFQRNMLINKGPESFEIINSPTVYSNFTVMRAKPHCTTRSANAGNIL